MAASKSDVSDKFCVLLEGLRGKFMGFLWSLVYLAVACAGEELSEGGASGRLREKGRLLVEYRMCLILQQLLVEED